MKILISACLLGIPCRYGRKSQAPAVGGGAGGPGMTLVPVCPERWADCQRPDTLGARGSVW